MNGGVDRKWIPLDVVDCIVDQLAGENSEDISSLRACSTVCKTFALLCQKRIFANVSLSDDPSSGSDIESFDDPPSGSDIESLHRLGCLLKRKPQISDYIRTLKYEHFADSETPEAFIFDYLRYVTTCHLSLRHTRLESVSWSLTTTTFKNAFYSFLSSNNIVRLTLEGAEDIPASIFGHLPGLVSLTTDRTTLATTRSEGCHQLAVPKLKSLRMKGPGKSFLQGLLLPQIRSSIDFSLLEDIDVGLDYLEPGMELVNDIISQSRSLRSISVNGSPPFLDMRNTLSSCLRAESLKTLKSIKLEIQLSSKDEDPYCYLSNELAKISNVNIIQEIELSISNMLDRECPTELEHWSSLDKVLSHPGGFPALRRVNIEFTVQYFESDPEELEAEMVFISDNAFPSLSTWDQIDFSMTVETYAF